MRAPSAPTEPSRLRTHLLRWSHWVCTHAGIVALLFALLTAAASWQIATRLGVNPNTDALLSGQLPWKQRQDQLLSEFAQRRDSIVALIEADTIQASRDAQHELAAALQGNDQFAAIYAPGADDFFAHNGLLFLSVAELEQLSQRLGDAQPLLGQLILDPGLAGLFKLLQIMHQQAPDHPQARRMQALIAQTLDEDLAGRAQRLDWQHIVGSAETHATAPRTLLIAQPAGELSGLASRDAVATVRAEAASLHTSARVSLTGALPLRIDELEAAQQGGVLAAVASLIAVLLILLLGLRSLALVAASLITLICGLTLTAAFAAISVGRLNLISIAFAVLYIGLAINYAVHLTLRYRELRIAQAHDEALSGAVADVGGSLLLCMLTTSAAFFAFLPTDYRGVAELGLIAGVGIIIGLICSLTLLPALMTLIRPGPRSAAAATNDTARTLPRTPIIAAAVALTVLAAGATTKLRFEYNPVHLKPAGIESVVAYQALTGSADAPLTSSVLTETAAEAAQLAAQLAGLPEVSRTVWLGSFVPRDQAVKLWLIDDLALLMGPVLQANLTLRPTDIENDVAALVQLQSALSGNVSQPSSLGSAIQRWLAAAPEADSLTRLRDLLLGDLPGMLRGLSLAMNASEVSMDALPEDLRARWLSAQGHWRVEILPAQDIARHGPLKAFVNAIQSIAPNATDAPVTFLAAGRSVQIAFAQAFAYALAAITLLLLLLLRSLGDTLRVLAPLLLGSLCLAALAALLPIPLNFANIIALPLLLGIAVDNGIHMIWRARLGTPPAALWRSSTGRAVALSAMTTLASFGALTLSSHRGMASMGWLLALGLCLALVLTLVLLPALLPRAKEQPVGMAVQDS